jgi:hypothetical protein
LTLCVSSSASFRTSLHPLFLPFIQRHATTTLLHSSQVYRCTISETNRTNRQYHKKTIHETCYLSRALVFPVPCSPRETSVCSILYYDTQHGTCMCVRACRWLVAAMCERRSKLCCKTAKCAPLENGDVWDVVPCCRYSLGKHDACGGEV